MTENKRHVSPDLRSGSEMTGFWRAKITFFSNLQIAVETTLEICGCRNFRSVDSFVLTFYNSELISSG